MDEKSSLPFLQVVNYDITSSSDDDDGEEARGFNLVYSAANLNPSLSQGECQTQPGTAGAAVITLSDSSGDELGAPPTKSKRQTSPHREPSPSCHPPNELNFHAAPAVVEETPLGLAEGDMPRCDEHASREEPSSTRELCHDKVVRRGKPVSYALELRELPNELSRFLAAVKAYFTQKVNLKRQRPPLSETTFAKSQERMLCKWTSESLLLSCFAFLVVFFEVCNFIYLLRILFVRKSRLTSCCFFSFAKGFLGFAKKASPDRALTPECFLRVTLIESYVEFLKVLSFVYCFALFEKFLDREP